ncbi:DUF1080 domain-containing protein [Kiritimatiellota bacterium B12222]|nr:DUF1080 domain-containing protein [Kiritimatiellota bacterium B12222]
MEPIRQLENEHLGYSDTPVLSSGYHVHDGTRPQMPVVKAEPNQVPSDAVILFDGSSLEGWTNCRDGEACGWKLVEDEAMEVVPGVGDIQTTAEFGSMQLHVEFMSPAVVKGMGQGRGNSGVFLMGQYEIQVLDNWENPTYADGTVGGIYGQTPPLVNSIRKPGEWNVYDILWKAPVFDAEDLVSPAVVTVLLNGVVQHHAVTLKGPTEHRVLPGYKAHADKGPLKLQDHGDLVRFKNIWVREL